MRLLGAETVEELGPKHVSIFSTSSPPSTQSFSAHIPPSDFEAKQHALSKVNTRMLERDIYDGPAGLEKLNMWVQSKL